MVGGICIDLKFSNPFVAPVAASWSKEEGKGRERPSLEKRKEGRDVVGLF